MQQTIIKVGNSAGIVLPQGIRKDIGLEIGDSVKISKGKKGEIVVSKARKIKTGGVNAKFMKMVDEFIVEHEDVLKELANR